jgi:hypothetical protein
MRRSIFLIVFGIVAALTFSGCASELDPMEVSESLAQVTETPPSPDEVGAYDAEANPDPVVEALECSPYLVVTARGSGEPSNAQLLSPVAKQISKARPGEVTTVDLDYPADTNVRQGGTRGVRVLIDTLNVQSETCPEQQFVLMGYSQGAMVVGDALATPDRRMLGEAAGEVQAKAVKQVLAAVFYGDPRFTGVESFNVGSFDPELNGIMPRQVGALDTYAESITSFCVEGDAVCQASLNIGASPESASTAQLQHIAYYSNGMQEKGAATVIAALDR